MDVDAGYRTVPLRRRRSLGARALLWGVVALLILLLGALALGFAFAGSATNLPAGTRIAGVDVGGLSTGEATRVLERRAAAVNAVPVTFTAGEKRWHISAKRLEVQVDWKAAVEAARERGDGFGPVQGLRRLSVRFFGAEVTPPTRVYDPALTYYLTRIENSLNAEPRDAAIALRGLKPAIVPAKAGVVLDRAAADDVVVRSLAGFARRASVALPVQTHPAAVNQARLRRALLQTRLALSAPVRLQLGERVWRLPRWRIAQLLQLPSGGATRLHIGGPAAERYFERLGKRVADAPVDAGFAVHPGGRVTITPDKPGRQLDLAKASAAVLTAALSRTDRATLLSVVAAAPERTTADAQAMGIHKVVSSYETIYGGDANRVHNVQLVAQLIDGALIAPGKEFSFNATTGERTADKGFLEAPVIVNGELQTGLGGGVCQVSTTVFNAAFEAGLPITARTNHALYISHYPQGRDATVNYPDLDLKFVNDTGHWLLLRTFVGSSSLVVNLYGTPTGRRVEAETGALNVVGAVPVKKVSDPSLPKGKQVVEEYGQPPRSTSVTRVVHAPNGKVRSRTTWYSSYRGEAQVVRVGTKAPAKTPPPKGETTTTGAGTTTTTPASTDATTTTPTTP
ncbi:MAG: VanW family protein [Gaiellaceae bacterium]